MQLDDPPIRRDIAAIIIGGGKISEQHILALRSIQGVEVRAICDLSPALARFAAERFNIRDCFIDYHEMLDKTEAEVVHILTPPATHEQIVHDCLAAGRHVVVEKPIALSNHVFKNLWQQAASRNLMLIENHNYRFNTPICKLQEIVSSDGIGTVQEVEVRMVLNIRKGGRYADENLPHPSHRLPAGIIHEFISHLSYLLLQFLPHVDSSPFDSVSAAWRNVGGGELFVYDDLDAQISSGSAIGRIRFSCHQWPDTFTVQVRGTNGMATAELFHPKFERIVPRSGGQHLTPLINASTTAWSSLSSGFGSLWQKVRNRSAYEGLGQFLNLTYRSLQSNTSPPVSYSDMDNTSRLIDAMLAEENRK